MVGCGAHGRCRGLIIKGAFGVAATCGLAMGVFAAIAPLTLSLAAAPGHARTGQAGKMPAPFGARHYHSKV
jgi:hypothetical protein